MTVTELVLPYMPVPAGSRGGVLRSQRLWVAHSTEGPMSRGNARALAGPNWFGGPAGTSAHAIFDPSEGIEMVKPNVVAYHVGPGANGFSLGSEHCGRVSLTKAEWLSPDGVEMLQRSAHWTAQYCRDFGIEPRWGKLSEIAAGAHVMCTHNDIRLVFGGTTHSDPGPNFPYAEYQGWVQSWFNGTDPTQEADVANTAKELEDAAYKAFTRYEQERHAAGQPTPQESYQSADDILKQAQANGSQLSTMRSDLANLKKTVEDFIASQKPAAPTK